MRTILLGMVLLLATAATAAPPTIHLRGDAFSPTTITIEAGQSVRFVNDDDDAHTVTAVDGTFDSKGLDTHQSWGHRFAKPGTYKVFCELHPFMKATILVKSAN